MTWRDPIVEEIRLIRDEHAAKFNYDLDAIFQDVKKHEESLREQGYKFVDLSVERGTKPEFPIPIVPLSQPVVSPDSAAAGS